MGNTTGVPRTLIKPEREAYMAGEEVRCTVYVEAPQAFSVSCLDVLISGNESCSMTSGGLVGFDSSGPSAQFSLMGTRFTLANFGGTIQPGMYEFPFNFTLPQYLPPSFNAQMAGKGNVLIRYELHALYRTPSSGEVKASSYMLRIADAWVPQGPSPLYSSGMQPGPCFGGKVAFTAHTETDVHPPGTSVTVVLGSENNGWCGVSRVRVRVETHTAWRVQGRQQHYTGRLIYTEVPVSLPTGKHQQKLRIALPRNMAGTIQTPMITNTHTLTLTPLIGPLKSQGPPVVLPLVVRGFPNQITPSPTGSPSMAAIPVITIVQMQDAPPPPQAPQVPERPPDYWNPRRNDAVTIGQIPPPYGDTPPPPATVPGGQQPQVQPPQGTQAPQSPEAKEQQEPPPGQSQSANLPHQPQVETPAAQAQQPQQRVPSNSSLPGYEA